MRHALVLAPLLTLALATALACCGGSASETPPPLKPTPPRSASARPARTPSPPPSSRTASRASAATGAGPGLRDERAAPLLEGPRERRPAPPVARLRARLRGHARPPRADVDARSRPHGSALPPAPSGTAATAAATAATHAVTSSSARPASFARPAPAAGSATPAADAPDRDRPRRGRPPGQAGVRGVQRSEIAPVSATTDDEGNFMLAAEAAGCVAVARHPEAVESEGVALVAGAKNELQLSRGGGIEGDVVDERGTPGPVHDCGRVVPGPLVERGAHGAGQERHRCARRLRLGFGSSRAATCSPRAPRAGPPRRAARSTSRLAAPPPTCASRSRGARR